MTLPTRLPTFEYFPDPEENGCISAEQTTCPCCGELRSHMYRGPIYATEDIDQVCPWCIADGRAAAKWDASFNDVNGAPDTVPESVIAQIAGRTPGYVTWQGNHWMFSANDALVFVGEVSGNELVAEADRRKMAACRAALAEWHVGAEFDLADLEVGGQPAVYLFQDRKTGDYAAFADMT